MEDEQTSQPAPASTAYRQPNPPAPDRYNGGYTGSTPQQPQPATPRSRPRELAPAPPEVNPDDEYTGDESTAEKRVERILLFYTDGSFREFLPSV